MGDLRRLCDMADNGQTTRTVARWLEIRGDDIRRCIDEIRRSARAGAREWRDRSAGRVNFEEKS